MTKLAVGLLLFLTLASYQGVRLNGWVYEDAAMQDVAEHGEPGFSVGPLTRNLSRWTVFATAQRFGPSPQAQHVLQLVGHLINGLLVFALASVCLPPIWALLSMGIFLLHPIQVETAAYVASRPDLLMTTGLLVALNLAVRGGWWCWTLAVVTLFVTLQAKQTGIVLAPLLLLVAWWRDPDNREGWAWSLAGTIAACLTLTLQVPHDLDALPYGPVLLPAYQSAAFLNLLRLVIVPVGFTIDHNVGIVAPGVALAALGVVGSAAVMGLVGAWRWTPTSRGIWPIFTLWPVLLLAPRFLLQASEFTNEHHLYAAMPAISMGIALGVKGLYERICASEGRSDVHVSGDQPEPSGSGLGAGDGCAA